MSWQKHFWKCHRAKGGATAVQHLQRTGGRPAQKGRPPPRPRPTHPSASISRRPGTTSTPRAKVKPPRDACPCCPSLQPTPPALKAVTLPASSYSPGHTPSVTKTLLPGGSRPPTCCVHRSTGRNKSQPILPTELAFGSISASLFLRRNEPVTHGNQLELTVGTPQASSAFGKLTRPGN